MADEPTQHERRSAPRLPDDTLTGRLEAMERRVMDLNRAHIKDVEDRISRRVQTIEERAVQTETTAVNSQSAVLAKVADVQSTVDRLSQTQADFMAWMHLEQTRAQKEAADAHDKALVEQTRADLLLAQQQTKIRRAKQRNKVVLTGIGVAGTVAASLGVWLFTQAGHETESTIAFAISGMVASVGVIIGLSLLWNPADGS